MTGLAFARAVAVRPSGAALRIALAVMRQLYLAIYVHAQAQLFMTRILNGLRMK